jgi:hypothetical protein
MSKLLEFHLPLYAKQTVMVKAEKDLFHSLGTLWKDAK